MITSFPSLCHYEYGRGWARRTASIRVADYVRKIKSWPTLRFKTLEEYLLESLLQGQVFDIREKPLLQELCGEIFQAVKNLTGFQRSILSLRCFEDMSYSQIAGILDCDEFRVRVQFLQARKLFKSGLKKQGIRGKYALSALVLFGKLTAGHKALADTITTSSVIFHTGMSITDLFLLSLKSRITIFLTAGIVLALTGGSIQKLRQPEIFFGIADTGNQSVRLLQHISAAEQVKYDKHWIFNLNQNLANMETVHGT